ncbi:MAG: polysaccharide biosynthesis C-terminal domain-containing protein [Clostridia bacterium]|nr:polysaccharide biosynthesis C-terminal domain-containing protein [Clostridia bacterium]
MSQTPARRFAFNALLLIAVNLFMRTVGVSFNVYLSNRAGGEVMGLFSLLSGVYTFAMTLGCGGINLGTTRLVADTLGTHGEASALGQREIRRCLGRCLVYSLCFGVGAGILMFVMAPTIGQDWLGDSRTVSSLRILALTLPPIALSSCLSGYFTAMRHVAPNAAVGMMTQFIRVGGCAYFLTLWLGKGVESTCLALVMGGALSEFFGLIFSFIAYLWDMHKRSEGYGGQTEAADNTEPAILGKLLGITIPVTLSACLRSGLITLQHILIPKGLRDSGANWSEALTSYGVLHSMVLPVVLFPSAFISSFSGLLVPEIAESHAAGDQDRVARISRRIIQPALFFSFGVAGIMSCFSHELGMLLYNSAEAGVYIRQLAPLIPIMYVDSSVDGVLKGMGEQVYSMNVNIADALCSVIMVWLLLPHMGLFGYVITIYVTETLNTTLSLTRMLRVSRMKVDLMKMVFGPLLCILGATCCVRLAGRLLALPSPQTTLALTVFITVTALIYLGLCRLVGVIGREEMREISGILPTFHSKKGREDPPFHQVELPSDTLDSASISRLSKADRSRTITK